MAVRRLTKEYFEVKFMGLNSLKSVTTINWNLMHWCLLIGPEEAPYDKGSFKVEVRFPMDYPFSPPDLRFKTRIYHPNVSRDGEVCLASITPPNNWSPATTMPQVVQVLIALIQFPDPSNPLRPDVNQEYLQERRKFMINAERYTIKYASSRPKKDITKPKKTEVQVEKSPISAVTLEEAEAEAEEEEEEDPDEKETE